MKKLASIVERLEKELATQFLSAEIQIVQPGESYRDVLAGFSEDAGYRLIIDVREQVTPEKDTELELLREKLRQKGFSDEQIRKIESGAD